jgi:hypothetical protein
MHKRLHALFSTLRAAGRGGYALHQLRVSSRSIYMYVPYQAGCDMEIETRRSPRAVIDIARDQNQVYTRQVTVIAGANSALPGPIPRKSAIIVDRSKPRPVSGHPISKRLIAEKDEQTRNESGYRQTTHE